MPGLSFHLTCGRLDGSNLLCTLITTDFGNALDFLLVIVIPSQLDMLIRLTAS